MYSLARIVFIAMVLVSLGSCEFQKKADTEFGSDYFRYALALIELHKIRFGSYPEELGDIQFTGKWDTHRLRSVEYTKLDSGYELNVTHGWVAAPDLTFPEDFWKGLDHVRSKHRGNPSTAPVRD